MTPTVRELLASERPTWSFEFFPPKTPEAEAQLWQALRELERLRPSFVSVTYGAGGSTREGTVSVTERIATDSTMTPLAHLTAVNHSVVELRHVISRLAAAGVRNIMALRGDPPKGETAFTPYKDGLRYGSDLVSLLKQRHPGFCLGVGGYPERHPEAISLEGDLTNLKRKVDAGADFITTQLFFDNSVYLRFVERCRTAGISIPIVPGIMPVLSLKQIQRFTTMCGATLPKKLITRLEAAADNHEVVETLGIDWALTQIRELLAQGAPGYHLYILNRAKAALSLAAGLAA